MLFALSLVPILVAVGAGVDFSRGVMVHQRMMQALDAAALAVGNATSKPSACAANGGSNAANACYELRQLAQRYFDQNYDTAGNAAYGTPDPVRISIEGQAVTLSSSLPLQLTLLGIRPINVAKPTVTASSTVVWGQTKLWVALVLDNSGSMDQGDRTGSKMSALKDAINNDEYGLLKTLQAAAASDGDVKVGIAPFTRSVNMGYSAFRNSNLIDWGEWEAPPANARTVSSSVGPGSPCPWSNDSHGFRCTNGSANSASSTNTVPGSGLLCPGIDNGSVNSHHRARYYNGCFDSTVSSTSSKTGSSTASVVCNNATSCTVNNYCSGYPRSDTSTSGNVSTVTTTTCACPVTGSNNRRTCTRTATPVTTTTLYSHAWKPNSRNTWSGCVMDRQRRNVQTQVTGGTGWRTPSAQDYDASNIQPGNSSAGEDSQFPAENPAACLSATVQGLTTNWSTLKSQIQNMDANGATNQGIGVAHGFQMLTTGAPYGTGTLPDGVTKVMILFSDGLNTQNRWWGNGSSEGTTETGYIDARMNATCTAAKNAGIVIYAIYVHIGTNGSSAALENCASGSDKYYDLTSGAQIKDAFKDIAQKITNLRVSR